MTVAPRFRVALVGAGHAAETHVAALRALPEVELVGVCDLDPARAAAAAERWGTVGYASLEQLVTAGANVVHVTTAPIVRARTALEALERGCHVLLEAPASEEPGDAGALAAVARDRGLTATVAHALRYEPQVARALEEVRRGAIGQVVSVDILRGAEYPPYAGGPLPPWSRDAGYPLRDLGVHCLDLIAELLGPIEHVDASWQSLGGDPNLAFDEWRAQVRCAGGLGQFQLTFNARPRQSQIIIHGTRGILTVDLIARSHGRQASTPLPPTAERLVHAVADLLPPLLEVPAQVARLARAAPSAAPGLREFVAEFYRRLGAELPPPVDLEAAGVLVGWVEQVARAADVDHEASVARFPRRATVPFLVTGASGALGRAVVARLRADGHRVRVFQRRIPAVAVDGVEYAFGNLGDPEAVARAIRGAEVVIHCGAATSGDWAAHLGSTIVGTQNVIEACRAHGVRQLVHISSLSVVDWAGSAGRGAITEEAPLEPRPEERGAYTRAKLEAETRVRAAAAAGLPCVILRPGQIFGGGIPLINGAVARAAAGRWLVLGDGRLTLPLVYIDDVVDAIVAAVDRQLVGGELIQLVDPIALTQDEVLTLAGGGRPVVRVPRALVFALGKASELPLGALGRSSPVALYRLRSALARLTYASDRAQALLGWSPRVGVRDGIRRVAGG
ncbi:MAG: NAD-dependent epimerase/dehydratase family protein [Kofleriaceae bacterium]